MERAARPHVPAAAALTPPRQPTPTARTGQLTRRQPRLDLTLIHAYREHRCLRAPRTARVDRLCSAWSGAGCAPSRDRTCLVLRRYGLHQASQIPAKIRPYVGVRCCSPTYGDVATAVATPRCRRPHRTPALQSRSDPSASVRVRPYSWPDLGASSTAVRRRPWTSAGLATRLATRRSGSNS